MNAKCLAKLIDDGLIKSSSELRKRSNSIAYSEILKYVTKESSRKLLMVKPTRSLSGVNVIALMCAPHDCPGKCVYCPKGSNAPQSYTGLEPAAMRAIRNDYDPKKQIIDRLSQYKATGHDTSKLELVVMGGTFLSMSRDYQDDFMRGVYQALNNSTSTDLNVLKRENELGSHRCVALTFETRPDVCSDDDINRMINYGVTRVELGCQSIYDDVLLRINRGHDVSSVKSAIKRLRDAGFKVDLHVMLGLPGSSLKRDFLMFKELFSNEDFMPDGLKIYPCLIIEGTKLHADWLKGEYKALSDDSAIKLLSRIMPLIPHFVRVKRVMRDIPSTVIIAGPKRSNLHELALKNAECNCLRCRETGRFRRAINPSLSTHKYRASGGDEFFISFEDFSTGALVGFARLRLSKEAFLRELHVYGNVTPVGCKGLEWQHKGYGSRLLAEAESIAKREGYTELKVLSGVGVREYYKKRGYLLKNNYMIKII